MKNRRYKTGDRVIYSPEMYSIENAIFLHKIGDYAFIRLEENKQLKKVHLNLIYAP